MNAATRASAEAPPRNVADDKVHESPTERQASTEVETAAEPTVAVEPTATVEPIPKSTTAALAREEAQSLSASDTSEPSESEQSEPTKYPGTIDLPSNITAEERELLDAELLYEMTEVNNVLGSLEKEMLDTVINETERVVHDVSMQRRYRFVQIPDLIDQALHRASEQLVKVITSTPFKTITTHPSVTDVRITQLHHVYNDLQDSLAHVKNADMAAEEEHIAEAAATIRNLGERCYSAYEKELTDARFVGTVEEWLKWGPTMRTRHATATEDIREDLAQMSATGDLARIHAQGVKIKLGKEIDEILAEFRKMIDSGVESVSIISSTDSDPSATSYHNLFSEHASSLWTRLTALRLDTARRFVKGIEHTRGVLNMPTRPSSGIIAALYRSDSTGAGNIPSGSPQSSECPCTVDNLTAKFVCYWAVIVSGLPAQIITNELLHKIKVLLDVKYLGERLSFPSLSLSEISMAIKDEFPDMQGPVSASDICAITTSHSLDDELAHEIEETLHGRGTGFSALSLTDLSSAIKSSTLLATPNTVHAGESVASTRPDGAHIRGKPEQESLHTRSDPQNQSEELLFGTEPAGKVAVDANATGTIEQAGLPVQTASISGAGFTESDTAQPDTEPSTEQELATGPTDSPESEATHEPTVSDSAPFVTADPYASTVAAAVEPTQTATEPTAQPIVTESRDELTVSATAPPAETTTEPIPNTVSVAEPTTLISATRAEANGIVVEPTAPVTADSTASVTEESTTPMTDDAAAKAEPTAEGAFELAGDTASKRTFKLTSGPVTAPIAPISEHEADPTNVPLYERALLTTAEPAVEPTAEQTTEPTAEPTTEPTVEPTTEPTTEPTAEPTAEPATEFAAAEPAITLNAEATTLNTVQVVPTATFEPTAETKSQQPPPAVTSAQIATTPSEPKPVTKSSVEAARTVDETTTNDAVVLAEPTDIPTTKPGHERSAPTVEPSETTRRLTSTEAPYTTEPVAVAAVSETIGMHDEL